MTNHTIHGAHYKLKYHWPWHQLVLPILLGMKDRFNIAVEEDFLICFNFVSRFGEYLMSLVISNVPVLVGSLVLPAPSVVKLGLNICFFLLSRCRCLLGCCCESITCFLNSFTVIGGGIEEPEGTNSSVSFLFRLSGNSGCCGIRYFPAG